MRPLLNVDDDRSLFDIVASGEYLAKVRVLERFFILCKNSATH